MFLPKRALSLSSALMLRLSWRPFFLIYCQIFLTASVLGKAAAPITAAKVFDGVKGLMKAGFGALFVLAFLGAAFLAGLATFLGAAFLAGFAAFFGAAFLAAGFLATFFTGFLVAIRVSP